MTALIIALILVLVLVNIRNGKTETGSTYCYYDLETTGLSSENDRIIQLSAVKVRNGRVIGEFDSYVNPHMTIKSFITKINGVSDDTVRNAPEFASAATAFIDFIGDATLVGYNNHRFDDRFINAEFERNGIAFRVHDTLDVYKLAKELQKDGLLDVERCKLTSVAEYFGFDTANAHNSLADCHLTLACHEAIKKRFNF